MASWNRRQIVKLTDISPVIDRRTLLSAMAIRVATMPLVVQGQPSTKAFTTMKRRGADGFLVASSGFLFPSRREVSELAREHALPAIAAFKEFPQAGLLMSYGPDLPEINRKAASYVDRIIKGAKPGDLPIELPNKFELAINVTTAKTFGLAIPQALLLRADELIS